MLQALQSVYQSEDLAFTTAEEACLATAHEVLDCNSTSDSLLATQLEELSNVTGRIRLPGVRIESEPAFLQFQLPAAYPDATAQLRVEAEGPRCVACVALWIVRPVSSTYRSAVSTCSTTCRDVLDNVASDLATFASDCQGQEALLVCVDHACTLLNSQVDQGRLQRHAPTREAAAPTCKATRPILKHAVVWCGACSMAGAWRGKFAPARIKCS